ncbi:MAG: putative nucleic acid-binding protein [Paracoccaceae bacterium]
MDKLFEHLPDDEISLEDALAALPEDPPVMTNSWETFMGYFPSLEITPKVSWHYGGIFRSLKKKGQMIGQNDLWIAATGLAHKHLVVTQNTSEFARVPGLEIRNF